MSIALQPHILIAEDVDDIAEILRLGLEREGFTVTTVPDGDAVLPIILSGTVDLAIIDVRMPRMDGMTVLHQIRTLPDIQLPVMLLTANVTQGEMDEGFAAGADAYVTKPFKIAEVVREIHRLLRD